jgi:small conductance mechanosensitive channel
MWNYRIRAIVFTGVVCIFAVWTNPVRSQEEAEAEPEAAQIEEIQSVPTGDPTAATTTKELDIPVDELQLLVKPLTLEELQNEATGWMLLLQNKAKEISLAEVAIKRQNIAIAQELEGVTDLEEAQKALEEAQKAQGSASPGTKEYEEGAKKVEEAKESFKKAQEVIEDAKTTKEELKEDKTLSGALEQAKNTGNLEKAKQTLDETQKSRDQMVAGSLEYDEVTKKIEKLEAAIKAVEDAQEDQKGAKPDSPEYEQATYQVEAALEAIKQLLQELGVGVTQQSSHDLDKATAILENTEIDNSGETQVAGSPGVVNTQQKLEQQEQRLEKTMEQLENSADAEEEAKNKLVVTVTELQAQLTAIVNRFNVILDELEKKGGKAEVYRQYVKAVSTVELDTKDTEGMGLRLLGWAKSEEGGMRWASNSGKFLSVLVVSMIVAQILGTILSLLLSKFDGISFLLRNFIVMSVKRGGIVLGFLLALTALEVSLGPIIALLGGLSFVLAFALQSNLGNLASGLMIMTYKPFDVGDEIKIGGLWGWVDSITLANIKLRGFGGQIFNVPNNTVWGDTIENLTTGKTRKIQMSFRVSFDQDLKVVEKLLLDIMKSHPQVLETPAPSTFVFSIEDYYISVYLGGWAKTSEFWDVHADIIRIIQERFNTAGIDLAAIPKAIEIAGVMDDHSEVSHLSPEVPASWGAGAVSKTPMNFVKEMDTKESEG